MEMSTYFSHAAAEFFSPTTAPKSNLDPLTLPNSRGIAQFVRHENGFEHCKSTDLKFEAAFIRCR